MRSQMPSSWPWFFASHVRKSADDVKLIIVLTASPPDWPSAMGFTSWILLCGMRPRRCAHLVWRERAGEIGVFSADQCPDCGRSWQPAARSETPKPSDGLRRLAVKVGQTKSQSVRSKVRKQVAGCSADGQWE